MKRRTWLVMMMGAVLGMASAAAQAQDASPADKEKALAYLESTKKAVLEATKGLSEAQWNFKAASDKWSVAECMEHIAAAEDFIRAMVVDNVMKAPAAPDRDLAKIDAGILAMIPDRSQKAQAPEPIKPTNRYGSPEGSIKHFLESRATTEDFLKKTPDLRGHAVDSPLGGAKVDGYEWVLFIAAHSERHTKQILEVKANENFPKK
jgi:DinB superfamily